ncbi:uncharacterized protein [Diabrotica undecimpunctata]|uniref:uncharacterized protein n=1 Tax=Diabrotica undecimpunctata TaxID=50387 RepID=UPI003B63FB43
MEARLPNPLSFEGNVAENFKRFKQSFEIYLMASGKSGKSDEVKVAILLNLIGEEGIEIYNSLELTEVQQGKLADVLEAFESYVTPRKNVVYERYLFYKRIQEEGEPFDHFLTDLKNKVRNCSKCEIFKSHNAKEPLLLRELPQAPFEKVASDILDYGGQSYLVLIDYFSKWLDIVKINSKTSQVVIKELKKIFSTHGIPYEVISDNMPYNSWHCQQFAKDWDFRFVTSSPRYPRSNGQAERAVQIAKNMLRKCDDLDMALLEYRNTPINGTDKTPAQLVTNRVLRSKLPSNKKHKDVNLKEEWEKLEAKRNEYKNYYDRNTKVRREIVPGENVGVREGREWRPGKILEKIDEAPRSYLVQKENGEVVRRNSYHLRPSLVKAEIKKNTDFAHNDRSLNSSSGNQSCGVEEPSTSQMNAENRTSARIKRPPVRFKDYQM